jgi:folate-binding protein YgfZ
MHSESFDPRSGDAPHWSESATTAGLEATYDSFSVTGPDAMTYLQSQVAQDISSLEVGGRCWSLLLEPTGKVVSLVRVRRSGDEEFHLDVDAGFGEITRQRIGRFMIRVDARLGEVRIGVEPDDVAHQRRIAARWPALGAEIIPGETIPAQTGVVGVSVSFTKGCYPGQELVERMDSRGAQAPKTLRVVQVDPGSAPGDPVRDEAGEHVGQVTSTSGSEALALVVRGAEVGELVDHR